MTSSELARVESRIPSRSEISDLAVLSNHLAKSGRFKDSTSGYQAFAKLLFGRDLGLSATAAMTGVHIIEGKPEISANVQAQMVNTYVGPDGERYRYRVREHDNEHCRIEFFQREAGQKWESLGCSKYTMADAKGAELAGKGTWRKHPRNMLFARAMSDGVAFLCPEVTNGVRVYHEGEIDVDGSQRDRPAPAAVMQDVPIDGEVVEGEVVDDGANDPTTTVRRPQLSEDLVTELVAARKAAGLPNEKVRAHLIDIGVEDVPAGNVSLKTIRSLTPTQASDLMDVFSAAIGPEASGGER